jgi:hypothetical protein
MARGVTESRDLQRLRRSNRRWRMAAVAGLLLAALLAGGGVAAAIALRKTAAAEVAFPAAPLPIREAVVPSDVAGNLLPALPGTLPGTVLEGWRYHLANPKVQKLDVESGGTGPSPRLRLVHPRRARFRLEAPEWVMNGVAEGRLRARLSALRGEDFVGTVKVIVVADERAGTGEPHERVVLNVDLPLNRKQVWEESRRIMDIRKPALGAATERVRYRIEAEFAGTLALGDLSLMFAEE